MSKSQSDSELLASRVLKDVIPRGTILGGGHLVGQTDHNRKSVTGKAVELALRGCCNCFTMMKEAGAGFSGGAVWEAETRALVGSTPITIYQLPYGSLSNGKKMVNTLGEPLSVVPLAKELAWPSMGVIAPEFHLLRAFMSFVTVALEEYPELKIYSIVGLPLDLNERVLHSQGKLEATREELAEIEKKKVGEYQDLGWLVSYTTALEYLNKRDINPA